MANPPENRVETELGFTTATRDLKDLEEKGALIRTGELKHTRYHLNVPGIQPLDWN